MATFAPWSMQSLASSGSASRSTVPATMVMHPAVTALLADAVTLTRDVAGETMTRMAFASSALSAARSAARPGNAPPRSSVSNRMPVTDSMSAIIPIVRAMPAT